MAIRTRFLALALIMLAGPLEAQDLNVERAQADYDAKKAQSDAAALRVSQEESLLAPYFSRIDNARRRVNTASSELDAARNRLTVVDRQISSLQREVSQLQDQIQRRTDEGIRIQDRLAQAERDEERLNSDLQQNEHKIDHTERRIRQLESRPNNESWTCIYSDRGHEEHRGGHRATHSDKSEAMRMAEEACLAVHGECRLSGCSQPSSNELEQLRQELRNLQNENSNIRNQIRNLQSDISRYKNDIVRIREDIRSMQSDVRTKQNDIESARRDRDRILIDIDQARAALDRAQSDLSVAESDLARARGPYDRAVAEYNRAKAETDSALRYLQQVIANYNAAKKRVLDLAKAEGQDHGSKEALGRAPADGSRVGSSEGAADGSQKGEADGRLLSYSKGYREGRSSPSVTAESAAAFASGQAEGSEWANEKAKQESFPKGFNAAYSAHLSKTPVNAETIDISSEISTNPGSQGNDLTGSNLHVGNKLPPKFDLPSDPQPKAPSNRIPTIRTPNPNGSSGTAPCSNMPRPEFTQLCIDEYNLNYVEAFGSSYRSAFTSAYTPAYNASASETYAQKLNQKYDDSYTKGQNDGAKDQGILAGFSDTIATAERQQFAAGEEQFRSQLQNGYMLVVRSSEVAETNMDGVMTPNEVVKLTLVIDNLGDEASPLGRFQVKINEVLKGSGLNFEVRELPALNPNTRTTLVGVVSLKNDGKFAGEKLTVKSSLIRNGAEILALETNRETHFPIELVDLKLDRDPRVNEAVSATAVLRNMSTLPQKAEKLKIYTSPGVVKIDNGIFPVQELAPGAGIEKRLTLTPGVWVSESVPVNFVSEVQDAAGNALLAQNLEKKINVKRSAAIHLFDLSGKPLSMPLKVRAGTRLQFRAQVVYNETTTRNGPFVLRYTRTSPDTIRPSNNSTISSNYGSLGPNSRPSPINYSFDIPSNLAGTKGWVMLQLDEGSAAIHAPQVYIDIN